jgi:mitochondrial fission 1 protein
MLAYKQSSTMHGYVRPVELLLPPKRLEICAQNSVQGLVKSSTRPDQQLGVMLLSEIFRTSPERRRECLYYLALGNYKLGNYGEARRYNDLLLEREPTNMQAVDLRTLIDDKVAKEGLMGLAIITGVTVAAGVVGGVLLRNLGRKR